jgi:hypothetical protein
MWKMKEYFGYVQITHTQKVLLMSVKPHFNLLKQISGKSKTVWFPYYTAITEGVITVHVPPTLGLISQNQLQLSRWRICVKRKAHSASSAIGHVDRDLHFDIIKKTVALNNNSNNYTFRKLWKTLSMTYKNVCSVFRDTVSNSKVAELK